jgi:hypothetical protein
VRQFQSEHLLDPDAIIGHDTIAALDEDIVAYDRNIAPPPPPPPPPKIDWYGRQPSGAARVPNALARSAEFRAGTTAGAWQHLNRAAVADGIEDLVAFPDHAQQGGNGLCTTAAFVNVWAQDAPDAYAAFAGALFESGSADLAPRQGGGGMRITASEALRRADYSAIRERMRSANQTPPSQADWMVMSAIRDASNLTVDFTGDPDDWISHTFGDGSLPMGELSDWMRAAGAWRAVVNEESPILGSSVDHAVGLDPARSRAILSIDAILLQPSGGGHSVVLRSPVTRSDGKVNLTVWSWTRLHSIHPTTDEFESNYSGATIAYL